MSPGWHYNVTTTRLHYNSTTTLIVLGVEQLRDQDLVTESSQYKAIYCTEFCWTSSPACMQCILRRCGRSYTRRTECGLRVSCPWHTAVSCAKMDEPIEMPFGEDSRWQEGPCIRWSSRSPYWNGHFWGEHVPYHCKVYEPRKGDVRGDTFLCQITLNPWFDRFIRFSGLTVVSNTDAEITKRPSRHA